MEITIIALSIAYLFGVCMGNAYLRWGDVEWWERVIVWFWPVTLPVIVLAKLVIAIFWS